LENNLGNIGNRSTDPTAYEQGLTSILPGQILVSGFNSWDGLANPTGAFANEAGKRLMFALHIIDGTNTFRLDNLSYDSNSTDPYNQLNFDGDFLGAGFNNRRIGINYGADGVKGGGDDITYQNGESSALLINELLYSGIGLAQSVYASDPGLTNQDKLDYFVASYLSPYTPFVVSEIYTLWNDAGAIIGTAQDSVIVDTPEPGSGLMLLSAGGALLAFRRSRRRSAK
jgi:hypothetical protein